MRAPKRSIRHSLGCPVRPRRHDNTRRRSRLDLFFAGGQREKVIWLFAIRFGLQELASLFRLLDNDLNGVALRSVNVEFGLFAFDEVNCFGLSKALKAPEPSDIRFRRAL
jgi:hypothetical protein